MKIALVGIDGIKVGKHNLKDPRLNEAHRLVKADKVVYAQADGRVRIERPDGINQLLPIILAGLYQELKYRVRRLRALAQNQISLDLAFFLALAGLSPLPASLAVYQLTLPDFQQMVLWNASDLLYAF